MDIRTFCLGILSQGDATGYEIKKILENRFSHFYDASFGSIYPALNRLTGDGLVSCRALAQEKRPDKKIYRITAAGRLAFLDALQAAPAADRIRSDFLAILSFAELLPASHLSELVESRIQAHREEIAHLEACLADIESPGTQFVCGYGIAVHKATLSYLEENRHLVEGAALLTAPRAAE